MSGFLAAAGILIFVIGMYMLTYVLNEKTEAPEGVQIESACHTCGSRGACSFNPKEHIKKDNEEVCEDYKAVT